MNATITAIKNSCKRLKESEIQLNAEWIPYMKAYRLYDPNSPQQTVAYVGTLEEAERPGYRIVECDIDTMHVECYE